MIGWPLWNAYWHPANSRKSYPGQREATLGHPVIIDVVSGCLRYPAMSLQMRRAVVLNQFQNQRFETFAPERRVRGFGDRGAEREKERELWPWIANAQCGDLHPKPAVVGLPGGATISTERLSRKDWRSERNRHPTLSALTSTVQSNLASSGAC
jgi:hypothetical protein